MGIFDTSILNTDKELTKDELIAEMVEKLEIILKREFPGSAPRQKVKVFKDRINFAAPCCGDSANNNYKKRGNIILEGKFRNMYKCHNCGVCMPVTSFFKKYGENLSLGALSVVSDNTYRIEEDTSKVFNSFYNIEETESYAIDRDEFKNAFHLLECSEQNNGHFYLVKRKQFSFKRFLYSPSHDILFVLNLTPNNKILGMQTRHLSGNYTGAKYKTYSLSKIYETFFKCDKEIPDSINTLSMVFNILCIDISKPVTILEGPMDSFLVKNSIALCGAGKHLNFPFSHRYLFDADKTGKEHAIEHLNNGEFVFLWEKYLKENGVPSKKKWDVNDLVIWADNNKVKLTKFDQYYSNDPLDLMDI